MGYIKLGIQRKITQREPESSLRYVVLVLPVLGGIAYVETILVRYAQIIVVLPQEINTFNVFL